MFDSLDLKITYNEDGEEGVYLTQEQLREQFIECRKTFNLSYELLAKCQELMLLSLKHGNLHTLVFPKKE